MCPINDEIVHSTVAHTSLHIEQLLLVTSIERNFSKQKITSSVFENPLEVFQTDGTISIPKEVILPWILPS